MPAFGFDASQWSCLDQMWNAERVELKRQTRRRVPTAFPVAAGEQDGHRGTGLVTPETQIAWGLGYIRAAYGTPCNAWAKWRARSPHWY